MPKEVKDKKRGIEAAELLATLGTHNKNPKHLREKIRTKLAIFRKKSEHLRSKSTNGMRLDYNYRLKLESRMQYPLGFGQMKACPGIVVGKASLN